MNIFHNNEITVGHNSVPSTSLAEYMKLVRKISVNTKLIEII